MSYVHVNASSKSLEAFSDLIGLSDVFLICPFGDGTYDGVLNVNGHLKVMEQGILSTACLKRKDKSSPRVQI